MVETDRTFCQYWIMLCRLQDSSVLQQEAAAFVARAGFPADFFLENMDVQPHCPACHAVIPMGITGYAVCPNGHSWGVFYSSILLLFTNNSSRSTMCYHILHLGDAICAYMRGLL